MLTPEQYAALHSIVTNASAETSAEAAKIDTLAQRALTTCRRLREMTGDAVSFSLDVWAHHTGNDYVEFSLYSPLLFGSRPTFNSLEDAEADFVRRWNEQRVEKAAEAGTLNQLETAMDAEENQQ